MHTMLGDTPEYTVSSKELRFIVRFLTFKIRRSSIRLQNDSRNSHAVKRCCTCIKCVTSYCSSIFSKRVLNVMRIATIPKTRKMSFENDVKGRVGRILEEGMQN
jgi:hypothetical protein